MKICNECLIEKEISEFDKKKNGQVAGYCKDCRRAKIKKHYKSNTEYYVNKAKSWNQKSVKKLEEYKQNLCCIDCNLPFKNQPWLCDFHHLNPNEKDLEVAHLKNYGMKRIMIEIKKCVPLCANCHRTRHNKIL